MPLGDGRASTHPMDVSKSWAARRAVRAKRAVIWGCSPTGRLTPFLNVVYNDQRSVFKSAYKRDGRSGLRVTPLRYMATGASALSKVFPNPLRAWCFTVFNYTPEDEERIKALVPKCERLAVGREIAPEEGTPHLQGYVRFKASRRAGWVQSSIKDGCHVEPRAGTETQAATYALEDGDILIDHGFNCDEGSRKRSRQEEMLEIIDEIEKGEPYGRIRLRHKGFVFWNRRAVLDYYHDHKRARGYTDTYEPPSSWDPRV